MSDKLTKKIDVQYESVLNASKALAELKTKLEKGEITQKEFDKATIRVEKDLNKAAKSIKQVGTELEKTTNKTKGMVNGFADLKAGFDGVMAGFNKLKQAVGGTIDAYVQFEKKSKEVQTLGVDDKTIKKIENDLKKVAQDTGKTYEDLWKGTYDTISSGAVSAADSVELVGKASKFAIGAVTDTGDAVNIAAKAINAFGMEAKDTDLIFNVLQETIRNGVTTGAELAQFLPEVFALSKQVGLGIKDMGIAMTGLTKGGFATNTAVTGLKAIETAVLTYGDKLKAANIAGVDFKKGQIKNFREFINSISSLPAPDIQKLVGSSEAVSAIGALGTQIKGAWVDSFEDANLEGSFERAFGKMEETAAQKMAKVKAKFDTAMIEIGESLMPLVEQVMKALTNLMPTIKQFGQIVAKVMTEVGRYFGNGGWIFGAILLFKKFGIGFDTFKNIFVDGWKAITGAMNSATGVVGLILTAASALIPLIMSLNRSNAELAEEASNAAKANLRLRDSMNAEVESLNKQKQSIAETITKLKEHQYLVRKYQGVADRTGITDELKIRAQEALATIRQSATELGGTSKLAIENLYTAAKDGSMKVEDALNKAIEVYEKAQGVIDKAIGENQKMSDKFTVAGGMAAIDAVSNALIQRKQLEQELDQAIKDGNKGRISEIADEQAKIVQTYELNKNTISQLFKEGGDNAKQISDYLQNEIQNGLFKTLNNKSEWIKAWDFGAAITGDYSKTNKDINEQYAYTLDILKQLKDEGTLLVDQQDELVSKYGEQADAAKIITGADLDRLTTAESITDVQYAQLQAQADTLTATLLQLGKEKEILETKLKQLNAQNDLFTMQRLTALGEIAENKNKEIAAKKELESIQAIIKGRKTIIKTTGNDDGGDGGTGGNKDTLTDKEKKELKKKQEKEAEELKKKREKEEEEKKKREEKLNRYWDKFVEDQEKFAEEQLKIYKEQLEEQRKLHDDINQTFDKLTPEGYKNVAEYQNAIEIEYLKKRGDILNSDLKDKQEALYYLQKRYKYVFEKAGVDFQEMIFKKTQEKLVQYESILGDINKGLKGNLKPIDETIEKFREATRLVKEVGISLNSVVGNQVQFMQKLDKDFFYHTRTSFDELGKDIFGKYLNPQDHVVDAAKQARSVGVLMKSIDFDLKKALDYLDFIRVNRALIGSQIKDRKYLAGEEWASSNYAPSGNKVRTINPMSMFDIGAAVISNQDLNSAASAALLNKTGKNVYSQTAIQAGQLDKTMTNTDVLVATYIGKYINGFGDIWEKVLKGELSLKTVVMDERYKSAVEQGMQDFYKELQDLYRDTTDPEQKKAFESIIRNQLELFADTGYVLSEQLRQDAYSDYRESQKDIDKKNQEMAQKLADLVKTLDFNVIADELSNYIINVRDTLDDSLDTIIEANKLGIDTGQLTEFKRNAIIFSDSINGMYESAYNIASQTTMMVAAKNTLEEQLKRSLNEGVIKEGDATFKQITDSIKVLDAKIIESQAATDKAMQNLNKIPDIIKTKMEILGTDINNRISEMKKEKMFSTMPFGIGELFKEDSTIKAFKDEILQFDQQIQIATDLIAENKKKLANKNISDDKRQELEASNKAQQQLIDESKKQKKEVEENLSDLEKFQSFSKTSSVIAQVIQGIDKLFNNIKNYISEMSALSTDMTKNTAEKSGAAISGAGQFAQDIPVVGEAITAGFSFIGGLVEWIGSMYQTDYEKQIQAMEAGIALQEQQLAAIERMNESFDSNLKIANTIARDSYNTADEQLKLLRDVYVEDTFVLPTSFNAERAVTAFLETGNIGQDITNMLNPSDIGAAGWGVEYWNNPDTFKATTGDFINALLSNGFSYDEIILKLKNVGVDISEYSTDLTKMTDDQVKELRANFVKQRDANQDFYDYYYNQYMTATDEDKKAEAEQWMNFYKLRVDAFQNNLDIIDQYYDYLYDQDELNRQQLQDELDQIDREYDLIKAKAELAGDEEAAAKADYDRWMAKAAAIKATMDKEKEAGTWGEGMNGLYTYEEEIEMQTQYNNALLEAKQIKEDTLNLDKESNDELKKALRAQGNLNGLQQQGANVTNPLANVNKILEGYNLPSYADGKDIVPFDQLAYIHQGERVMTAQQNAKYMKGLDNTYANTTNNIINNNQKADITFNGVTDASLTKLDQILKSYGINGIKGAAVKLQKVS